MRTTISYTTKIHGTSPATNDALARTIHEYQTQVAYFTKIVNDNYETIQNLPTNHEKEMLIERLVHNTKNNTATYDYDQQYPRTPSYLRRAAITDAIANVTSYKEQHQAWEQTHKGREPHLRVYQHKTPTFYNTGMYQAPTGEGDTHAKIKLYDGHNQWGWHDITLNKRDQTALNDKISHDGRILKAPVIQKSKKGYVLRFAIERTDTLTTTPELERRICAVDLGINTPATCVIMDPDGTVLSRKFTHLRSEKARVRRTRNRIRKRQAQGARDLKKSWGVADNANRALSIATAREIVDFAVLWSCETVVFEYLDFSGSRKRKHHTCPSVGLWCARDVQARVERSCHELGLRVSRVCAANTSRLAFDGSGRVERGREVGPDVGFGVVRFSSGKLYSADLNAALNIGARFFARALVKSCSVTGGSVLRANVPALWHRSTLVLSDLLVALEVLAVHSGNARGATV